MIDIDFLPADYVCVQITRKNNTWLRGLFVAVLVLMALGWMAQKKSIRDLTLRRDRINTQTTAVMAQLDSGDELRAELKQVENDGRLLNGLRTQTPPTRWLTAIVGALPDQATISEIHSEVDDGSDVLARHDAPTQPGPPNAQPSVDPVLQDLRRLAQLTPRKALTISVRGTATDDLEVSAFLLSLHETQLFERVQLLFTDHFAVGDRTLRSFAIKLRTRSMTSQRLPSKTSAPVASGPKSSSRT